MHMPSISEFEQYRHEHTVVPLEATPTLTDVLAESPRFPLTQYVYGVSSDMRVFGFDTKNQVKPILVIGDRGAGKNRLAQLVAGQAGGREHVRVDVLTGRSELWQGYSAQTVHVHDVTQAGLTVLADYDTHIYQPEREEDPGLTRILCIDSLPLVIDARKTRPQQDELSRILRHGSSHDIIIIASMNIARYTLGPPSYKDWVKLFPSRIFGFSADVRTAAVLGCQHPQELARFSPGVEYRLSTPSASVDIWTPRLS